MEYNMKIWLFWQRPKIFVEDSLFYVSIDLEIRRSDNYVNIASGK